MGQFARSPWMALAMATLVIVEWWWRTRVARRGYDGRDARASLAIAAGNLFTGALGALVLGSVFAAASRISPLHWPLRDWRVWLAGFVAVEFMYYWFHRFSHTVRWIWATHAVHHSPEEMTLLSSLRLGWTNLFSFGWVFYLPLVLLGFDPRMLFALLAFDLHYQFFLHTEAVGRLGPLEWVLNTPEHHRVHHASNAEYLDCNYGGVVIVFDRLFGTLREQRADEPIRYGLAHPFASKQPFAIAFGEWKRLFADMKTATGMRNALRIALGRP
ncbi:MAG TPA: sterol desaturase family protein [Xanthomonadaceae bacterium]|jgi:sterol desaturase/sphingolipid hydroxylase (fatty acid hydroxylase superfamily)|nr:sterol desaturase family protein [Xanthomonadaceae bacterium]